MKYVTILLVFVFFLIEKNIAFSQNQNVIALIDSMEKYYNDNTVLSKSYGYQALSLANELKDIKGIAMANKHLASNFIIWDQYDSALYCANKAKEVFLILNDSLNILYCQQYIISAYQLKEDYKIAIDECKKFLKNPLVQKNDDLYYKMLQNLAIMYGTTDYYENAISMYNKALDYFLRINDPDKIINACNDIMLLHSLLDYVDGFDEPIKLFNTAYPLALKINNLQKQSALLSRMSNVYLENGDFQKAKNYLEQSLSIKEEMNDLEALSYGYQDMVVIYTRESNYDMAINYLQRSMKINSELKNHANIYHDFELMATLLQKQGKYEQSIDYFNQALEIAQEYGFWQGYLSCLQGKIFSYSALGIFHEAKLAFNEYLDYYETHHFLDQNEKLFWEQEYNNKTTLDKELEQKNKSHITTIQILFAVVGVILLCWLFFAFGKVSRKSKK